jgi:DNA-binding MarR family transcriptional regulator
MDREGEALFRSAIGISLAQFLILSVVDAHPGSLNQQAIADRLGLTKGTVSKQLEIATRDGLVDIAPSPHSRREKSVKLTARGATLVKQGDQAFEKARDASTEGISRSEIAAALALLTKLNAALGGS